MNERCKTCRWWGLQNAYKPFLRMCQSPNFIEGEFEAKPDSLVYSFEEGGSFWTGPEFGCVHHKPMELTAGDTAAAGAAQAGGVA